MHCISKRRVKEYNLFNRAFHQTLTPVLIKCLIAILILVPQCMAMRTHTALFPLSPVSSYSQYQLTPGWFSLMSEGQALLKQQTKEALAKALAKFKEAFALSEKSGNKGEMGASRFNEGIAYDGLGKPREALSAFLDAERYFDAGGWSFLNPMLQAITGTTYARLGETDKALDYLNRALPTLRQINIPQFLAHALRELGHVNIDIGQKRKGIEYLNEALNLYRRLRRGELTRK